MRVFLEHGNEVSDSGAIDPRGEKPPLHVLPMFYILLRYSGRGVKNSMCGKKRGWGGEERQRERRKEEKRGKEKKRKENEEREKIRSEERGGTW